MANHNECTDEQKFKTENIKLEQLEEDAYSHPEVQSEPNPNKTIKIEESPLTLSVSKYECISCEAIFTDKSSLEHHSNENHQNVDDKKSIGTAKDLKIETEHLTTADTLTKSEKKWVKCPQCTKTLRRPYLERHLRAHSNDGLYKCHENGCKKSFRNKSGFNGHMIVHSGVKPFKCQIQGCPKSYKRVNDLNVHISTHIGDRPFNCSHTGCIDSFRSLRHLKVHQFRKHNIQRPREEVPEEVKLYICQHTRCKKSFKLKRNLDKHLRVHNVEKPYKCQNVGCNHFSKTQYDLSVHNRVHSDVKLFECRQIGCSKAFKSKYGLNAHMTTHSDKRRFDCQYATCTMAFKTKAAFDMHMISHSVKFNSRLRCLEDGANRKNEGKESTVDSGISPELSSDVEGVLKTACVWIKCEDTNGEEDEF